jgi:hypothetical protein
MGRKARYVGGLTAPRSRITLELCPESARALQAMLDGVNRVHGDIGYGPVVRAALIEIYRSGAWIKMEIESLKAARMRNELRALTRSDEPTIDFTKEA